MKRIIFLASGNGGTLKFLKNAIESLNLPWTIVAVVSDRNCNAIKYADSVKIKSFVFENWNQCIGEVNDCISSFDVDIIITNIHKILFKSTLECCSSKYVNLHYSLLPAFGGVIGFKTLDLARKNNTKIIGATVHLVDENLDGGKILCQGAFAVDWDMDAIEHIGDKVFRTGCLSLFNAIHILLYFDNDEIVKYNHCDILFSPPLTYRAEQFDDSFWSLIKNFD